MAHARTAWAQTSIAALTWPGERRIVVLTGVDLGEVVADRALAASPTPGRSSMRASVGCQGARLTPIKENEMLSHRVRRAGLSLGVGALLALGVSAPARADAVTDWNQHA